MANKNQGVRTVIELAERLKEYQSDLTITIFDTDLGDAPVSFKSEKAQKGNQVLKWITLFPSEKPKKTTVGEVLSILEKCPQKMLITMRGQDGAYSDLFTSLESMVGDISNNKWVVISDKTSYEKYFQSTEPTSKERALKKTATEIGEKATTTEKIIHGWLIKQTDETLFTGVLKEDRTIKDSIVFAIGKAQKMAQGQKATVADDETVFEWIREYFTAEKVDLPKIQGKMSTAKDKSSKKKGKESEKVVKGQYSLF